LITGDPVGLREYSAGCKTDISISPKWLRNTGYLYTHRIRSACIHISIRSASKPFYPILHSCINVPSGRGGREREREKERERERETGSERERERERERGRERDKERKGQREKEREKER